MVEVALTVGIVATVVAVLSRMAAAVFRPDPIEAMIGATSTVEGIAAVLYALGIVIASIAFAVAAIGAVWR